MFVELCDFAPLEEVRRGGELRGGGAKPKLTGLLPSELGPNLVFWPMLDSVQGRGDYGD